MEIRETDQKDERTSERLSDLANKMNHLTLDLQVEIYTSANLEKLIKKDMERIFPGFKL